MSFLVYSNRLCYIMHEGKKMTEQQKNKFERWKYAVQHMSPYRMDVNRYIGSLGSVIGLFIGLCWLVGISIINKTINFVWLFFFLPFVLFLQVLNLIGSWQHLNEMRKIKHLVHNINQMEGGK